MCKRRERLESELAIDEYIEVVVVLITKRNCKQPLGASRKVPKKSRVVNRPINGLKGDVSGHYRQFASGWCSGRLKSISLSPNETE